MKLFTEGSVALVTGASRGIGADIVRTLAREGAEVLFTYRQAEEQARALEKEVRSEGGAATAYRVDVTDEAAVRDIFREVRHQHGRLDTLICNAGIRRDGLMASMSTDQFASVVQVNLIGTFLCCREGLRLMMPRRSGSITLVASAVGHVAAVGQANYCASKAAIQSLARTMALEAAPYGIRINSVSPGYVDTDMSRGVPPDVLETQIEHVPLKRLATTEEVARAITMMASEGYSYATGTDVLIDGGALSGLMSPPRILSGRRAWLSAASTARNGKV